MRKDKDYFQYKQISRNLHSYKYLWQACTKRETVVKAWIKLRKGKTTRREVLRIESNFDYYVDRMIETIENTRPGGDYKKSFHPKRLNPHHIKEHGKERTIYCPSIWDQWVHHIVTLVLEPIITKYSYKWSCGSMPKRGGLYGKRELERVIKKHGFKYFAKFDIRHFFNSIHINVVIKELREFIKDSWFIYLIRRIFIQFPKGLPLGFYISQWMANFVLSRVDWFIVNTNPICYIRYMDDFVVCGNNKRKLHSLIFKVSKVLRTLGLKLKHNYQVSRFIYKSKGEPIDFMGYVFYRKKVIIRKRILINATRLAKRLSHINSIALHQAQSMLSRLGWFKHTDTKYLYINYIQPNVSVGSLKSIISKDSKRRFLLHENKLGNRAIESQAA